MNDIGLKLQSAVGLAVFLLLCWALSENRKRIPWRVLAWGLGLQVIIALAVLKSPPGQALFRAAGMAFNALIGFSNHGAEFLFGKLVSDFSIGAVFAFQVLPVIVFVSGLAGLLYYFRVIQFVVNLFAKLMRVSMRISGAEALGASLLVFSGIESATVLRPYLHRMTRSELFVYMTAFMSTIATSVMAAYVGFGASAGHLLAASFMSAPAAVVAAKLLVPECGTPETMEGASLAAVSSEKNPLEAIVNGTGTGLKLALQVGALLLVFIGLIYFANGILSPLKLSLEKVLGWVFTPFAVLMGVPWKEAPIVGQLLGVKTVFNEFLGYARLQAVMPSLSPRSVVIATYSLCGFANFGSMGILIAGLSAVIPERKSEIVSLALRSLLAGTIACFMTAVIAGWFV
jgi:CNT family concentrative nucleoside transporter